MPKAEVNLSVFPEQIQLQTARDYQSFIAVVRRTDDVTLDVTETAVWKLADEKFAKIEGNRVLSRGRRRDGTDLRLRIDTDSRSRDGQSQRGKAADQF